MADETTADTTTGGRPAAAPPPEPAGQLEADGLPALYYAADAASTQGQRRYLLAMRIQLSMAVLGAIGGALSFRIGGAGLDVGGVVASVAFSTAAIIEVLVGQRHFDRAWYVGRAVAESVKTLAWKFAAGGDPFPLTTDRDGGPAVGERLLLAGIDEILEDAGRADLELQAQVGAPITAKMRAMRGADLDTRRARYRTERLEDQQRWYTAKARFHRGRGTMWTTVLLIAQLAGLVLGLLRASGALGVDVLGIVGAGMAAIGAWSQTRQHELQSRAYALSAIELGSVITRSEHETTEEEWAVFVRDAEEAISREHKLWAAQRGSALPHAGG